MAAKKPKPDVPRKGDGPPRRESTEPIIIQCQSCGIKRTVTRKGLDELEPGITKLFKIK